MKTCSCRGVMHVCAESWEGMRRAFGMTRDELDRMLTPARAQQAALALILPPRNPQPATQDPHRMSG